MLEATKRKVEARKQELLSKQAAGVVVGAGGMPRGPLMAAPPAPLLAAPGGAPGAADMSQLKANVAAR